MVTKEYQWHASTVERRVDGPAAAIDEAVVLAH